MRGTINVSIKWLFFLTSLTYTNQKHYHLCAWKYSTYFKKEIDKSILFVELWSCLKIFLEVKSVELIAVINENEDKKFKTAKITTLGKRYSLYF